MGGGSSPAGVAAEGLAVRVPQRTHVRARETTNLIEPERSGSGSARTVLSTVRPIGEPARGASRSPTAASSNPSSSLRRGTSHRAKTASSNDRATIPRCGPVREADIAPLDFEIQSRRFVSNCPSWVVMEVGGSIANAHIDRVTFEAAWSSQERATT